MEYQSKKEKLDTVSNRIMSDRQLTGRNVDLYASTAEKCSSIAVRNQIEYTDMSGECQGIEGRAARRLVAVFHSRKMLAL